MSIPPAAPHPAKGTLATHLPASASSTSPPAHTGIATPQAAASTSTSSSRPFHYGPYTASPPDSTSPPPTLKSMVAETTGQKRKRAPPDIAGIPMSVIREPERYDVRECREVRTPNRRGLCAKEAATTYNPKRAAPAYIDDTDTDDDDIVLVF